MVLTSPDDVIVPPTELRRLMFDVIKSKGDDIFMIDGLDDVYVTYQELYQKAVSIAIFLNKAEVAEGTVVGVLSDATINANCFFTGVWFSGGTLCPMNPALKPVEIRQLLDVCGAKMFYCQSKYLDTLEAALALDGSAMEVTVISDSPSASCIDINDIVNEDPTDFEVGEYDQEESISHILFTSGTTGVPKGVMITSFSAKYTAHSVKMNVERFMCTSPPYWISYLAVYLCVVLNGNTIIVPRTKYLPGTNESDVSHIMECAEKYKPSNWFTAPSVVLQMCDVGVSYDMSSLTRVGVGGSNLLSSQRQLVCDKLFQGRRILYNMYGATEVGVITGWPPGEAPDHDSTRAASLGNPASGLQIKVVDPSTGVELGPGEVGEFVVKSVAIMKGYINKEMPKRYSQDDWYHMGDLGWFDEDGYLYFSSRLKEIMKYRGFQISPAEIEIVAIQHPGVQEVCVVGRSHAIDGERPAAFVVRKSQDLTEQELMDFVHERVGDSKKLRGGVFFIEEIPKSGVGKTLRRELIKILEAMDA
ncbi:hypothetical protein GE061_000832 [Apolygus lucorum]|uniref:Luciferin 4-monooxygenase n=1 Tax=Apolygus lucorum TaxID=248454 RepID=A0A8S9Y5E3_APOLU|nr:hypothetical protein GE061_000832 [Apolygus lucorum]